MTSAERRVIDTAIEFERETNIPLEMKDLVLSSMRRKELYEAVKELNRERREIASTIEGGRPCGCPDHSSIAIHNKDRKRA